MKLLNKYQNFNCIITRTANVYGSHQQLYRFIPKLILSCLKGEKFFLDGNGNSSRSFIHIDDVNEALYKISNSNNTNFNFHISSKKIISIKELAEKICKKLKCNPKKILVKSDDRLGKDKYYKLNSNFLRKKLKWKDHISLDEGIEETKDWIIKNFNHFKKDNLLYKHKK
jgi:dTDP-glucose 4,6-dehydratase